MTLLSQSTNERMRPWLTPDDKAAVMAVLDSGDLMSGKQVALFEEELAAYFGKRHAVCVSSGTAALECAFVATGEGGKIHPDGFVAILSAARAAGHEPKPGKKKGVRTAILGMGPYDVVTRVVDSCHRFDRKACFGDVHCFSFAQNKFIAAGGGCLVTDDSTVAAHARQHRNHGRDGGPEIHGPGRNLRMGEMNAALGRSQLKRIDEILARRKQVAEWYDERLGVHHDLGSHTRESWFLYCAHLGAEAPKGQRTLNDFRLFDTANGFASGFWLLPIWPLMTREDCEAVCAS